MKWNINDNDNDEEMKIMGKIIMKKKWKYEKRK